MPPLCLTSSDQTLSAHDKNYSEILNETPRQTLVSRMCQAVKTSLLEPCRGGTPQREEEEEEEVPWRRPDGFAENNKFRSDDRNTRPLKKANNEKETEPHRTHQRSSMRLKKNLTKTTTLLIALTLFLTGLVGLSQACRLQPPCRSCRALSTVAHPGDCSKYFTCSRGRVFAPQMCDRGVYSSGKRTCVEGDKRDCVPLRSNRTSVVGLVIPSTFPGEHVPPTTPSTTRTRTMAATGFSFIEIITRKPIVGVEPPKTGVARSTGINSGLCGIKTARNIVGGHGSDPGEWPWQVSLQFYDTRRRRFRHFCGGTLIASQWVLTAAHCLMGKSASNLFVAVGSQFLDRHDPGERRIAVKKAIRHPRYSHYGNYPNDIALLQLSAGVEGDGEGGRTSARPACLQKAWQETSEEKPSSRYDASSKGCWITGYGATFGTANRMALNELRLSIVDQYLCRLKWGGFITDSHICGGMGTPGACRGDSGGPLVCSHEGRFFLVGVTSWGESTCLLKGHPNIFTRVSHYRPWIDSVVGRDHYNYN